MLHKELIIIYSIIIVLLFVFSAIFSSADMAYGSVSELRLKAYIKENNSKRAKIALKLAENYENTISTILFLNDLCNIANETIAALLGYYVFENIAGANKELGSVVFTTIVLVLVIIFGEILPKALTKPRTFKLALRYAYVFNFFVMILKPFAFIVSKFGEGFIRLFKVGKDNTKVVSEELEEMVDAIEEEGIVDEDSADILRGTIDYAETEAYEIMTPRVDLYAIDIEDDPNEYLNNEETYSHSRIPVYQDTIDNVVGFVTVKDLIRARLQGKDFDIKDYLKQPLRFPRSTEINDILIEFKKTKTHFAIINDEYGGIEGIVTMEDILEEIVGEIWDEEDEVEELIDETSDDNTYVIDGSLNFLDFLEFFEIDDEIDTEYVTIGGYCIELLDDRFAKIGDVVHLKNLDIKVLAVDENNTIEKLLVTKNLIEESIEE